MDFNGLGCFFVGPIGLIRPIRLIGRQKLVDLLTC